MAYKKTSYFYDKQFSCVRNPRIHLILMQRSTFFRFVSSNGENFFLFFDIVLESPAAAAAMAMFASGTGAGTGAGAGGITLFLVSVEKNQMTCCEGRQNVRRVVPRFNLSMTDLKQNLYPILKFFYASAIYPKFAFYPSREEHLAL